MTKGMACPRCGAVALKFAARLAAGLPCWHCSKRRYQGPPRRRFRTPAFTPPPPQVDPGRQGRIAQARGRVEAGVSAPVVCSRLYRLEATREAEAGGGKERGSDYQA